MNKTQLYTYLQTQTGITALVGTRIYAERVRQGAALPCLVLTQVFGSHAFHSTGGAGLAQSAVQIDAWADTEPGAEALGEQVRLSVDTYVGSMGSTVVQSARITSTLDGYEQPSDGSDKGTFRRTFNVEFWYEQVAP